jgi:hypothetical protein
MLRGPGALVGHMWRELLQQPLDARSVHLDAALSELSDEADPPATT